MLWPPLVTDECCIMANDQLWDLPSPRAAVHELCKNLTCESCGSHQPFIVYEEEIGELDER
jgi:hypothetical protein